MTTYAYDANNRLLTETKTTSNRVDAKTYHYDPNGNQVGMTQELYSAGALSAALNLSLGVASGEIYRYNEFNQLVQTYNEAGMVSYAYNAAGLRVGKTVGGVETVFVLDGGNVALELESGTVTAKYLWAMNLVCGVRGVNTRYYLYNGHGDVAQLTDSSGAVTQSYAYDAFGVEAAPDDNDTNPFRYCGEYYDLSSNTYYLRNRYYSPTTGRFLAEDSYRGNIHDPLTLNLYTYCANNPIFYVDPLGTDYYIYYGSDQEWAAQQYEKQLKKDFKDVPIHMIFVENPDVFYERWEAMGIESGKKVTIDGVIINLHANPENIYASDKNALDLSKTSNDRKIETLLLLACNAGHIDNDNNIAIQFLKQFNIGNVIAPDGTHTRHKSHGFFGIGASLKNSSQADDTFQYYVEKYGGNKDRGSYGFVSFSLNSLGQVAYNFDILDSMNGSKIRAADLFKHKHYFAGGAKGLR